MLNDITTNMIYFKMNETDIKKVPKATCLCEDSLSDKSDDIRIR